MKGFYCDCKRTTGAMHETTIDSEEICTNCGHYAVYINDEVNNKQGKE